MIRIFLLITVFISQTLVASAAGVRGHEPSYISYTTRYQDSDLDNSFRIHLSFRYDFKDVPFTENDKNFFFTYTGDFDFYWLCGDCRKSSPVVGRVFNPALHWRTWEGNGKYVEMSFHHRSNGQVTDADEPNGDGGFLADTKYQEGDIEHIDSISRSSNYIQLEYRYSLKNNDVFYIRWRPLFDSHESNRTWRLNESRKTDFADFDRAEFIYSRDFSCDKRLQVNWSIGDSGFSQDSIDIGYQYNVKGIPLYFSAHHGPMETLSDHSRSVNSVGIGVVFWDVSFDGKCD